MMPGVAILEPMPPPSKKCRLKRAIIELLSSAFSPICSPMNCQWGQKALSGYLGSNKENWRRYDACALLEDGAQLTDLLVDQGRSDQFLETQLKPELLERACERASVPLTLRMHEGYDHSYFFISTFIADHLRWHAQRLGIT